MKRVPPSTRTKEAIRSLLQNGSEDGDPKSELMKLGIRRIVEEALEQAVADLLGRDYYERKDGKQGYRNGQRTGRLKSAEGEHAGPGGAPLPLADPRAAPVSEK